MKIKDEKGLAAVDMAIAVIAVVIFSTIIVFLMYNNIRENIKLKKETLAMIYITEIFENVGIESYQNLANGNYLDIGKNDYNTVIEKLVPNEAIDIFAIDIRITNELEDVENNEDILKKITVTLTYNINDKYYTCSMERMKIKE